MKFLHENNCNYNSYRFSYKFAFILFLSFLTNPKQESGFQQVGGPVTRNISVFYSLFLIFIVSCCDSSSSSSSKSELAVFTFSTSSMHSFCNFSRQSYLHQFYLHSSDIIYVNIFVNRKIL